MTTESKKKKLIIMWIVLIIGTIVLGCIVNFIFFHKDAVPDQSGYYESKVYITDYGNCYHSVSCGYLHTSKIAIGKKEAIDAGYRACSACGGRPSESIYVEGKDGSPAQDNYFGSIVLVSLGITLWLGIFWFYQIEKSE